MASALRGAGAISSYVLSIVSPYHWITRAELGASTLSASAMGRPVSIASSKANSSRCSLRSCAQRNIIAFLSRGFISLHTPESYAFLADATARLISSVSPDATLQIKCPSLGEKFSKVLPLAASTNFPSMKICDCGLRSSARFCQV